MKFQTFRGIRLKNFAFKFDLRHFFESAKAKTLPLFSFKRLFRFFKTPKTPEAGAYSPFFSSNLHKNLQITKLDNLSPSFDFSKRRFIRRGILPMNSVPDHKPMQERYQRFSHHTKRIRWLSVSGNRRYALSVTITCTFLKSHWRPIVYFCGCFAKTTSTPTPTFAPTLR